MAHMVFTEAMGLRWMGDNPMNSYEISCKSSGFCFGIYEGDTEIEALDKLARDAGYKNHKEACKAIGDDPDDPDLMVVLLPF